MEHPAYHSGIAETTQFLILQGQLAKEGAERLAAFLETWFPGYSFRIDDDLPQLEDAAFHVLPILSNGPGRLPGSTAMCSYPSQARMAEISAAIEIYMKSSALN